MKLFLNLGLTVVFLAGFVHVLRGQTDEVRQATGLPIPIGAPVIYGRVNVNGLKPGERKPTIFVSLLLGGVQIERQQTNDDGYYYFLTMPRNGAVLVFETNGNEIGRVVLTTGPGNVVREDISLDLRSVVQVGKAAAGVISAKYLYERSADNQKKLDKAIAASRDKQSELALSLLKELVTVDPNDFAG